MYNFVVIRFLDLFFSHFYMIFYLKNEYDLQTHRYFNVLKKSCSKAKTITFYKIASRSVYDICINLCVLACLSCILLACNYHIDYSCL